MSAPVNEGIRYQPEEKCSVWLAGGVGMQGVMTVLAIIVLFTAIAAASAGQSAETLEWSVFAALTVCGVICGLQAASIGRVGGGHVLITGVSPNYIAVSILALEVGGSAGLASLIVLSALFYLMVARWLPVLRKVVTPVVSGTVLMLIATITLPFSVNRLTEVTPGGSQAAGLVVALITLAAVTILVLRAKGTWRLWALLIGITTGCVAAVPFGLYDYQKCWKRLGSVCLQSASGEWI